MCESLNRALSSTKRAQAHRSTAHIAVRITQAIPLQQKPAA